MGGLPLASATPLQLLHAPPSIFHPVTAFDVVCSSFSTPGPTANSHVMIAWSEFVASFSCSSAHSSMMKEVRAWLYREWCRRASDRG
jgi:hypothetical protein